MFEVIKQESLSSRVLFRPEEYPTLNSNVAGLFSSVGVIVVSETVSVVMGLDSAKM